MNWVEFVRDTRGALASLCVLRLIHGDKERGSKY